MNKILLVNKEKGYTSRDVVNIISKKFKTKKVGHFGTLDPLAEGLLVIGIGKFTKVGNLFSSDTKEYICEVLIGRSTDTYDITGKTLCESDFNLSYNDLSNCLNSFVCEYLQQVPMYSAVKVNGKKLYEYARSNIEAVPPSKMVKIFNIHLINYCDNYFSFSCKVSRGTYIRSLINDISNKLDIPMCMSNLKRVKQDIFDIKDSYTLNDILNDNYKFLDLEDIFDIIKIEIPSNMFKLIINGSLIDNVYNRDMVIFTKDGNNYVLYVKYDKDSSKMKPYLFF